MMVEQKHSMVAGTAQTLHHDPYLEAEKEHWESHESFETSKPASSDSTSSNKTTLPNPSQTVPPTVKAPPCIQICEPMQVLLTLCLIV